jgi:hypothetical protein
MARYAQLVAVGVVEAGAVIIGMIFEAQPGCAGARPALYERDSVRTVDRRTVGREEGCHLAIAGHVFALERRAEQEQGRACPGNCQPAQGRPRSQNRCSIPSAAISGG